MLELNTGWVKSTKTFVDVDFHFKFAARKLGAAAYASCAGKSIDKGTPIDHTMTNALIIAAKTF